MTLYEQAKKLPNGKRSRLVGKELEDLAIAWLTEDLGYGQIKAVLLGDEKRKRSSNVYNNLAQALRSAYVSGRIVIK